MSLHISNHCTLFPQFSYAHAKQPDVNIMWHNFPLTAPFDHQSRRRLIHRAARWCSPLATHKGFSNLKFDIDGALYSAAAMLSLAVANILPHVDNSRRTISMQK